MHLPSIIILFSFSMVMLRDGEGEHDVRGGARVRTEGKEADRKSPEGNRLD